MARLLRLTNGQPYFMEGLSEGEVNIDLKLVDKDGKKSRRAI